ncbi:MAG: LysR family transcriptional regulator [Planctomycetaceae bacterium]|nr:LysR family transcriptional regulator [Planctomycetaceae bacterium]
MDFRELEYFAAMASEKNLSRAAEKLIVSQSTLSKTLAKLEEKTGCPLFARVQHGLHLTEAGENFSEITRRLLRIKHEMDAELHAISQGSAGRVHFGISYTFSKSLVPKVLPIFSRDNPQIEVVIHTETSSVLENLLVDGGIDVAVIVETRRNRSLLYEVLFYEEILLAIAPDNPLCDQAVTRDGEDYPYIAPASLVDAKFILSQEHMRLRDSADAFFKAEKIAPDIAVTTASVSTAIHLASHDVGVAFVPLSYALSPIEPPAPRFFTTAPTLPDWKVSIVRKRNTSKKPLLGSFIKSFKSAM